MQGVVDGLAPATWSDGVACRWPARPDLECRRVVAELGVAHWPAVGCKHDHLVRYARAGWHSAEINVPVRTAHRHDALLVQVLHKADNRQPITPLTPAESCRQRTPARLSRAHPSSVRAIWPACQGRAVGAIPHAGNERMGCRNWPWPLTPCGQ